MHQELSTEPNPLRIGLLVLRMGVGGGEGFGIENNRELKIENNHKHKRP